MLQFAVSYCGAATVDGVSANANNCDLAYKDSTGAQKYLLWTHKGRFWIKVLNSLGYAIPQSGTLNASDTN